MHVSIQPTGRQNPSIWNCWFGKLESIFVSVKTIISTLFCIICFSCSNLPVTEFIFRLAIISLFLTLHLSFDNILSLLLASCCTGREFVTGDSGPFFELSTVCQKCIVSNTLFMT